MSSFRFEPIILLFAAGLGVGLVFPLSKYATLAGIPPLTYIGLSAFGASVVLFVIAAFVRTPIRVGSRTLRYAAIAGATTYAIPFGMLTFVVAHIGTGIPAVLQSLTPMFTFALVYYSRAEPNSPLRLAGLGLGLVGVIILLLSRHSVLAGEGPALIWLVAAFVTPLALACGNVYRSLDWPPGEKPVALAAMTFAAASILMLGLEAIWRVSSGGGPPLVQVLRAWPIVVTQGLASGLGYFFFFRLQQVGGPVYLSQISYVNTAVGVIFAALLFGERIGGAMVAAILFIFAGIALVNGSGSRQPNVNATRVTD